VYTAGRPPVGRVLGILRRRSSLRPAPCFAPLLSSYARTNLSFPSSQFFHLPIVSRSCISSRVDCMVRGIRCCVYQWVQLDRRGLVLWGWQRLFVCVDPSTLSSATRTLPIGRWYGTLLSLLTLYKPGD